MPIPIPIPILLILIVRPQYIPYHVPNRVADPIDSPVQGFVHGPQGPLRCVGGQVQPIVQRLGPGGLPPPLLLLLLLSPREEGIELLVGIPMGTVRVRRVLILGLLLVLLLLILLILLLPLGLRLLRPSAPLAALLLLPLLLLILSLLLLRPLPQAGVVLGPPLLLAERLERLVDAGEPVRRRLLVGVIPVLVGMPLEGQLAVGPLDGLGVGAGVDLEDCVVVGVVVGGGGADGGERGERGEERRPAEEQQDGAPAPRGVPYHLGLPLVAVLRLPPHIAGRREWY